MTPDEKHMKLQGYVRVTNNSGEDYANAKTRLIVGKVHILDRIAQLARRKYPYGTPQGMPRSMRERKETEHLRKARRVMAGAELSMARAPKKVKKEGLSEYFLYTIEGTETIPDGWSKRLPSFEEESVPVVNLYKHEQKRYGNGVVRFLSFKNDEEHNLGDTPIPGGMLKVYRTVDKQEHLSYEGQSNFKYIPVGEDVELNLGRVRNVVVEPALMDYKTDRYLFDRHGNISGWDEIREFKVEVKNTRPVPVKIEITRNFDTQYWDIENRGDHGKYKKVDLDTVKYTLGLDAGAKKEFSYILTTHHGRRAE
jgi:hypothetical protein